MSSTQLPRSSTRECYIKHIDASHSVRIIVQSIDEERRKIRRGSWSAGLFSCLRTGEDGAGYMRTCCVPWMCPCIPIAQACARFGIWSYTRAVILFLVLQAIRIACAAAIAIQLEFKSTHPQSFVLALGLLIGASLVYGCAVFSLRIRIRALFEIPGSYCSDLLVSCCCQCCVMGQLASHVKESAHDESRLFSTTQDTLPAYEAPL